MTSSALISSSDSPDELDPEDEELPLLPLDPESSSAKAVFYPNAGLNPSAVVVNLVALPASS